MLHDCLYLKFKNRRTNLQWEPQRFEPRQLTVVRLPRRGRKDVLGWQKWFIGLSGSIRYTSVYWVFSSKLKLYFYDLCISLHGKREKLTGSSVWVGLCQLVGFTVGSRLGCSIRRFQMVTITGSSWPYRYRPGCQCSESQVEKESLTMQTAT